MGSEEGRLHGRVYAGLVLTMIFWGSAFATSKMLVLEVPPEVGAALRFGFGSLLMMAILFRRSANPIPARGDWGRLAVVSLVGVTGFNSLRSVVGKPPRVRKGAAQGARIARRPAISRSIPSTAVLSRKLP